MIVNKDCLEYMKTLKDNSVDAIITDPPYGLAFMGKKWDNMDSKQFEKFTNQWARACWDALKPGGFLLAFGGTRTYHRLVCGIEDAGFEIRDTIMWLYGSGFPKSLNIGKQIDKIQGNEREEHIEKRNGGGIKNKQSYEGGFEVNSGERLVSKGNSEWEGWGTALKPACEPIVVARKPLSEKNVALNVLKWGTGGINIDGCRVGYKEGDKTGFRPNCYNKDYNKDSNVDFGVNKNIAEQNQQGRFPANIILDEEAGKMLGEPSRFFYCAKASKSERSFGCEGLDEKTTDDGREVVSDRPHQRGATQRKNNHPTVKPIKLMEYLVKLVSKEGATVLDPFLGSGTTVIACVKQNRNFIGIEKEEEYIKITNARIKYWQDKIKQEGIQKGLA